MRLRFTGTAAVGLALAFIVYAAIGVLFNGPDAPLAEEASILAFIFLAAGVVLLFCGLFTGRQAARAKRSDVARVLDATPALDYTIVIPVYNRPALLVQLIGAIEEHSERWRGCGSGEIVVVNDGSTDSTPAVAERLIAHSTLPMRVVSQANKGVSGARNRGFWEARGRVGVVIDSDCLPSEEWLPRMLAAVNEHPSSIAFAEIYSDRPVRYPLEASPSGSRFAGASFAMAVSSYIAMGGNCERFSGASRDDTDLVLTAREAGFEPIAAPGARVWHPIRQQSAGDVFRTGLNHRYDNLLVRRHGDRALAFTGDRLLGWALAGHYPTSLLLYAFVLLVLYDLATAALAGKPPDVGEIVQLAVVLIAGWLIAQSVAARMLKIPAKTWSAFVTRNVMHVFGVALGRLRGCVAYGLVLL